MVGHEVFISQMKDQIRIFQKQNRRIMTNVIKLRDDEPSGYYCLDGIFI